jgi:hypothetical protein
LATRLRVFSDTDGVENRFRRFLFACPLQSPRTDHERFSAVQKFEGANLGRTPEASFSC